jgi:uncharacterized membrane protein
MLKSSFWYPTSGKQGIALLAVLSMIPLHQSELFGLMDSTVIVFGWIPAQLMFDIVFNIVAVAVLILMYYIAPAPPEEQQSADETVDT